MAWYKHTPDPSGEVRRGYTPYTPHISMQLPRDVREVVIPEGFKVTRLPEGSARGLRHVSAGRRGDAPTNTHAARYTSTISKQRWR